MRLLWLVILVTCAPALADNTADEADIAFSLGNQAYAKRDYERALAQYFLSYRLVPNRNVLFNIARCYEALERFDEAYRYWNDLFVDRALSESDRRDVGLNLKRLQPHVALVTVTTTPASADLFVDREDLGSRGQTPRTVAVPPGTHAIVLRAPGYRLALANVKAVLGEEVRRDVKLDRILGKVRFQATPPDAVLRESEGGPALARVGDVLEAPPGQRLYVVTADGHVSGQLLLEVRADELVEAKATLPLRPRPTGKLIVTANRENAVVRVDGQEAGFTPTVLSLPVGEHELEVAAPDVAAFRQRVKVAPDTEQRFTVELRYAPPKVSAASKSSLDVDWAPASVTVITQEEIRAFGYQTLPDALRAVRGYFFTDDRIYSYAGVRGFFPPGDLNTRILVLWDGHPVNDVWAGQGYLGREFGVDLNEVERIEVVRGPTSTLFGTGAVFGVINVVPRASLGGRFVEAVGGVGDQRGGKGRLTVGYQKDEKTSVIASVAGFASAGAEQTDFGPPVGLVQGLDGERSLMGSAQGRWNGFTLSGRWVQRRKQIPTGVSRAELNVAGTEYWDARGFAELKYERSFERVSLLGRLSYDGSRYEGWFARLDEESGQIQRQGDSGHADWITAQARVQVTLFERNRLSVDVEGQLQLVRQRQRLDAVEDHRQRWLFSATVLDEWQIVPGRLFVQAGARLDKYSDVEFAFAPRAAIVGKPYLTGTTKLVVGQAFRAPNTYELYFSDDNVSQRAAEFLKPELITTFELEHSHDFTPEFRATVGAYFNLIDRLVRLREEPSGVRRCGPGGRMDEPCLVFVNVGEQLQAVGAEAQVRWQPGRFTLVDATYSFVFLRGTGVNEASAYPMHLASLKGMVPLKEGWVRLSGQGTYQSARRDAAGAAQGEALLLDLGLSGEYGPVRYFAGVKNLLDSRYLLPITTEASVPFAPQYGRTFWLELAAGF